MKIAELYASLGIEVDRSDIRKTEHELDRFAKRTEQTFQRTEKRINRAIVPDRDRIRREAALWRSEQVKRQRIHERMEADANRRSRLREALTRRRSLGGVGGALAAGSFTAALGVAVRDALRFDEALTALDVSSQGAMGTLDSVRARVLSVSKETGVAKESILEGARSFVALTGNGKAAANMMETFARVARGQGAEMSDVASTAAALNQQLGITPENMEKAFSILSAGGKKGAVEFSDMAGLMASLAASFKQFGGSQGVAGVAQLSAMFQIARQDFGSAAEAETGLRRAMESLTSPRTLKALGELGIKVLDANNQLLPMSQIVDQMAASPLISDPRLMNKAFESSEARRTWRALLLNVDAMKRLARETMDATDVTKDYERVSRSTSAQVQKSWNGIKVAIQEALDPERMKAAAEAAGAAATAFGFMLEKFVGFGEDLGTSAAIVKDLLFGGPKADPNGSPVARARWLDQENTLDALLRESGRSASEIAKMSPIEVARLGAQHGVRDVVMGTGKGASAFGVIEAAKRRVAEEVEEERRMFQRFGAVLPKEQQEFPGQRFRFDTHEARRAFTFGPELPDLPGASTAPVSKPISVRTGDTTIHVEIKGDASPEAIERIRQVVREENERQARDIAAAVGQ